MEVKINEGNLNKGKIIRPNETSDIRCSNCDKKLAIINVNKISQTSLYELQVECPFCKDKSWKIDIDGKLAIRPADGVVFIDILTDDLSVLYKTEKVK